MFKPVFSIALAAAAAVILTSANQPAEAARIKGCAYVARDAKGEIVSLGTAKGLKMKKVCNRARWRCNRARKKTKVNRSRLPLSPCVRLWIRTNLAWWYRVV